MPLEDLERRMAAFDKAGTRFEAERRTAADLLAGDRIRLLGELEADAEQLRVSFSVKSDSKAFGNRFFI